MGTLRPETEKGHNPIMKNKSTAGLSAQEDKLTPSGKKNAAQDSTASPSSKEKKQNSGVNAFEQIMSPHFLFQVFFKRFFTLLTVGVVCTLIGMMFFTIRNENSASKIMSLNYEESTKGKTPNGSRFNLSSFLTQDYLNDIIEHIGFQNELTAEALTEIITIEPTSNGRVITDESGYYINSSYSVRMELPWSLRQKISAQDLLDEVCFMLEKKFTEENRVTIKSLDINLDYSDMDYDEISAYFSMMLNRIVNYIDVRNNQAGSFISESGMTYSLLKKACRNLESYTLAELNSYIWENGIAKDTQRRIRDLRELNRELSWDYSGSSQKNTILMEILSMYNNKMVSSVLIPTYDSKGAFYMSRTKVGIDDLTLDANAYLTEATSLDKSIKTNLSKIKQLESGSPKSKQERADEMIQVIGNELCTIVGQLNELDDDCYAQRISRYLLFTEPNISAVQKYGVKNSLAVAVVICGIGYVGAVILQYGRERKKWLE